MKNWISSFMLIVGLIVTGFGITQAATNSQKIEIAANQQGATAINANTDVQLWKSSVPFTGDATRFVFQSNRSGNNDIYIMQVNGSHLVQLTTHPADDVTPAWSPDGTKIVFASYRDNNWEIYTMNADGSAQTRLTNNAKFDGNPAWSPDGNRITFASERDGNREIYVMNANGSNPQRLTTHSRIDDQPAWSPEGSQIVFTSDRDDDREIYAMASDGSDLRRLTNSAAVDEHPSWSPDGNRITFVSMRDDGLIGEIYVMDQDGTNPQRLTDNDFYETEPVWSPDGDRIAFSRFVFGQVETTKELYTVTSFGGAPVRITDNQVEDSSPAWQPLALNQGFIAYNLLVKNTTSTEATNVTVTDPLPNAVHFLFINAPDWNCNTPNEGVSGTVSCSIASIGGLESKTIEIFGDLRATESDAVVTNTATTSAANDSTPGNNSATAVRQVTDATDLVLELFAPTLIESGGEITYTLAISNLSSTAAQDVTIVDTLPQELSFLFCSASGNGSCVENNGTITVSYASILPSQIETIQLKAGIESKVPANVLLTNSAFASSNTLDLNANDNHASSTAAFAGSKRDVRIAKQINRSTVATNAQMAYTLQVYNAGPTDLAPQIASAKRFTNTQPISISSCANSNPNCFSGITVSGLTAPIYKVAVSLFEFSHDSPQAVDLLLVAPDGTKVTLLSDAGNNIDPGVINILFDDDGNPANNVEALFDTIYQPTNFGSSDAFGALGAVNDSQPTLGRMEQVGNPNGTWKLYAVDDEGIGGAINGGWSIAIVDASAAVEKIVLSDSLPKGTSFVAASGNSWQIAQANGKVTANLFKLSTGVTSTVVITVAAPSTAGWITNTATVAVPGETNMANNSASAAAWIEAPIAQLTAQNSSPNSLGVATAFTATVSSGSTIHYEWNFGDGSPTATGVTVSHTYPAIGSYTAIVTATNQVNLMVGTTAVTISSKSNNIYLPLVSR